MDNAHRYVPTCDLERPAIYPVDAWPEVRTSRKDLKLPPPLPPFATPPPRQRFHLDPSDPFDWNATA